MSPSMHDVIIVGGGHNALAAAFYLAKGGRRPLVLERRRHVGGGATTAEIHPGFRGPTLSHESLLDQRIAGDMQLMRHGFRSMSAPVIACAPAADGGPSLVLWNDVHASIESLRAASPKDAEAYAAFRTTVDRLAAVVGGVFDAPPPDIDAPKASDVWGLLQTGRRFRALGKRDAFRLLRWVSMPASDLTSEWFETERLRAMIAAPGLSGTMLGPRSAGSSLVLLLREANRLRAGGQAVRARGGPGVLTHAMAEAAREAGAEIRTGVAVEQILVRDARVVGVVADGQEISCPTVLSGIDPKTTFLSLVDPVELTPDFTTKVRNYRAAGTVAKVNLALAALPTFAGISDPMALSGRIHIGPDLDYLERAFDSAKYGEISASPWLDVSIPSILDPDLAPAGAHVASIYTHYAPFRLRARDWQDAKDPLLASTLSTLETCAPGIGSLIVAADVLTPADLAAELGSSGGHIFHGELSLDQLFTMRPLLGHARYASPVQGLHLCGAGTHPGGFMTGVSGRLAAQALLGS